jgi:hypothetical protein
MFPRIARMLLLETMRETLVRSPGQVEKARTVREQQSAGPDP